MTEAGETFVCPRVAEATLPIQIDHGKAAHWRHDGTCSYCGSITEKAFFAAVEAGQEIHPTDKSYKAYVMPGHDKFYFQHLSDAGRDRFIELANAKTMNLAYPDYFYTLPFFCARRESAG